MHVAIVTNALDWPTRGNHTTIQRWLAHLDGVDAIAVPADPDQELDPVPDIVHGYHALNGGVAARTLARRYARPLVVSLGGTDLLALVERSAHADEVASILGSASWVTGAFDSFGALLEAGVPYTTIRRGVAVPGSVPTRVPDGRLSVLLPSGLRPVKDPLLATEMASDLVAGGLRVHLRIVGPRLDDAYAQRVLERAEALPFVEVGEIEPEQMATAYATADVVWNTSRFEGGSNALLEGLAHGCACFARNVPGNRDLLDASNLFEPGDGIAIERFHRRLLDETDEARQARIARDRTHLRAFHDPRDEARALEALWRSVASAS